MILCDGARGPLMAVIPIVHWSGHLSLAVLLAVTFALGAFSAPYFAAQKMIVPELLGEDEGLVTRASALFQGATRMTMLLGPVTGGILISLASAPAVLLIDAATYLVSATLVAGLVPQPLPSDGEDRGIRRGIGFLAREPLLRIWTPVFAIGDSGWTAFFVSVPVLVVARFGANPRIAGLLVAAFGVGALLGNVISYRVLMQKVEGLRVISVFVLGQALPLWLLTFHLHCKGQEPAAHRARHRGADLDVRVADDVSRVALVRAPDDRIDGTDGPRDRGGARADGDPRHPERDVHLAAGRGARCS